MNINNFPSVTIAVNWMFYEIVGSSQQEEIFNLTNYEECKPTYAIEIHGKEER